MTEINRVKINAGTVYEPYYSRTGKEVVGNDSRPFLLEQMLKDPTVKLIYEYFMSGVINTSKLLGGVSCTPRNEVPQENIPQQKPESPQNNSHTKTESQEDLKDDTRSSNTATTNSNVTEQNSYTNSTQNTNSQNNTSQPTEEPNQTNATESKEIYFNFTTDPHYDKFEAANWANYGVFNCYWLPKNATFDKINGLTLNLVKEDCNNFPYTSAEYRTKDEIYSYGYYETCMKVAKGKGLITAFFVYAGKFGETSHNEIDIEILGKNTNQMQVNYYSKGQGGNEKIIELGFDASQSFNKYGFMWKKDSIEWFVNDQPVHKAYSNIPEGPVKIMVNLWPATKDVENWAGPVFTGNSANASFKWIYHKAE